MINTAVEKARENRLLLETSNIPREAKEPVGNIERTKGKWEGAAGMLEKKKAGGSRLTPD